jgi:hypothetical protein
MNDHMTINFVLLISQHRYEREKVKRHKSDKFDRETQPPSTRVGSTGIALRNPFALVTSSTTINRSCVLTREFVCFLTGLVSDLSVPADNNVANYL